MQSSACRSAARACRPASARRTSWARAPSSARPLSLDPPCLALGDFRRRLRRLFCLAGLLGRLALGQTALFCVLGFQIGDALGLGCFLGLELAPLLDAAALLLLGLLGLGRALGLLGLARLLGLALVLDFLCRRGLARRLGLGNFLGSLGLCRLPCLVGLGSLLGCLGVCHSLRRLLRSPGVLGLLGFLRSPRVVQPLGVRKPLGLVGLPGVLCGFLSCLPGVLGCLGVRYLLGFLRLLGLRNLARLVGLPGVLGCLGVRCLLGFLRLLGLRNLAASSAFLASSAALASAAFLAWSVFRASSVFLTSASRLAASPRRVSARRRSSCVLGGVRRLGRVRLHWGAGFGCATSAAFSGGLAGVGFGSATGSLLVGGAAPSVSLRMIDWKRWLDRVSQSSLCSSGAGLLATAAGGEGFAAGGTGAGAAPPPCASLRMIDRYSRLECSSHRTAAAHGSSPAAGPGEGAAGGLPCACATRSSFMTSPKRREAASARSSARCRIASAALPPPSAPPDCARATGRADSQHRQHRDNHASSLHGTLASSSPDPRAPVLSDSCGRMLR